MLFRLMGVLFLVLGLGLSGCGQAPVPAAEPTESVPRELVIAAWPEDVMADFGERFTAETGIPVRFEAYDTQEEAIEQLRNGIVYDVLVMENDHIPTLIEEGLVAELNRANIPNWKNVSLTFRDLTHDPGNRYTIPYTWGTTGIMVRTDLVDRPITRWADLWDTEYAGRVAQWTSTPRYTVGIALKTLGYSANSEDPAELAAARDLLIEVKPRTFWAHEEESVAPYLSDGSIVLGVGWAYDLEVAQAETPSVEYVIPVEGTLLWGDNFVIPTTSRNRELAEQFIDFVLRADISAEIVMEGHYPTANDAALALVDPELLQNPIIFPPAEQLQHADLLLPLSKAGQELHDAIWQEFLAAPGGED